MPQKMLEVSDDPIQKFLRLCLTAPRDSTALSTTRQVALQNNLDWQVVIQKARAQRIGPLLYYALRGQDFVPSYLADALRADYEHTARRNLFLFAELTRALHCLGEQQVPVIVLKGAALAQMLYGNSALRPLRDLDLLVS